MLLNLVNKIITRFKSETIIETDFTYDWGKKDYSPFTFDTISYSPNKMYCVSWYGGSEDNGQKLKGQVALLKNGYLVYKMDLSDPDICKVSDTGVVVCCNKGEVLCLGVFLVFDISGETICMYDVTANISLCGISDDGQIAVFTTAMSSTEDSCSTFIINVENNELVGKRESEWNYSDCMIKIHTEKRIISIRDIFRKKTMKIKY